VNALLHTDISQPGVGVSEEVGKLLADGFKTIKIKVGRGSLAGDMEMVNRASEMLPAGVRLRLDANRLWNFETALEFGKKVDKRFIEYIEEPFIINDIGQISEFYSQTGIGVALDESLNGIISRGLDIPVGVVAFILKPTLLGGFGRTGELVELAIGHGIKPVISSCFEVGPGFTALLKMAAAIEGDSASGLDTLKYLEGNLFSRAVKIENGFINIKKIATDEHGQTRTKAKKLKSTDY
jgi:o-succinylbenzoate synthase